MVCGLWFGVCGVLIVVWCCCWWVGWLVGWLIDWLVDLFVCLPVCCCCFGVDVGVGDWCMVICDWWLVLDDWCMLFGVCLLCVVC